MITFFIFTLACIITANSAFKLRGIIPEQNSSTFPVSPPVTPIIPDQSGGGIIGIGSTVLPSPSTNVSPIYPSPITYNNGGLVGSTMYPSPINGGLVGSNFYPSGVRYTGGLVGSTMYPSTLAYNGGLVGSNFYPSGVRYTGGLVGSSPYSALIGSGVYQSNQKIPTPDKSSLPVS